MIQRVLTYDSATLECVARIPTDSAFARDGVAPSFVGIEVAAQAAAALEALLGREAGRQPGPRLGYLVGIREARFEMARLPAGRELRARVRLMGGAPPLAIHEVHVTHEGAACLTAIVSTFGPSTDSSREGELR